MQQHDFVRQREASQRQEPHVVPERMRVLLDDGGSVAALDLTAGYRIDRYRRLEVGYGHFRPAGYLQGAPAGAVASNWVYASSSFTF